VSSGEPSKEISGWVAAAFWHGKGHKRRLWWFYGTAAAAERYRKAHHLKWVFYGTLAQGKAWQRKHVKAEHKPPHGRKPRSFKAEGAQLLRAEKHPAKPKAKPHPPRQPSPRHPQKPPPKPKARPPARARPAAPPPPQRKRHR
jgi:hypothetical protein